MALGRIVTLKTGRRPQQEGANGDTAAFAGNVQGCERMNMAGSRSTFVIRSGDFVPKTASMSWACQDHVIRGRPAITMDGTWLWQQNNGFQNKAAGLPGLPHPNDGANRKAYYRLLSTPAGFDNICSTGRRMWRCRWGRSVATYG